MTGSPAQVSRASRDSQPTSGEPEKSNIEQPATTYDAFQLVSSGFEGTVNRSPSRLLSARNMFTTETVELLHIYQNGIGTWMDVLDLSSAFQHQVLRSVTSSPLLLHAVCALSAKQMSLISNEGRWDSISARHYGYSLELLIGELISNEHDRDIALSATILLCSFELLARPGADYERHLHGARTLVKARDMVTDGSTLAHASFWVYARHDVALALVHGRPTLISPDKWPGIPERDQNRSDGLAKRILWILAKVIAVKWSLVNSGGPVIDVLGLEDSISELDLWWNALPLHARGVDVESISEQGPAQVWFSSASAAAGCLYYHLAKILCFECMLESLTRSTLSRSLRVDWLAGLKVHARAIVSICLSPTVADAVLVVAVNPLFYAGKHTEQLPIREKISNLLQNIESRLGFHTQNRVGQLQELWLITF